ncbi:hypothetical protein ACU4GD_19400 [Cupriavidus basilensis]
MKHNRHVILAIDEGTSGTRAAVVAADGHVSCLGVHGAPGGRAAAWRGGTGCERDPGEDHRRVPRDDCARAAGAVANRGAGPGHPAGHGGAGIPAPAARSCPPWSGRTRATSANSTRWRQPGTRR